MKPPLKLGFSDMWPDGMQIIEGLLSHRYDVRLSDDPDLLFSVFGLQHLAYSCRKVFITGENFRPDFGICDFALSFDHLDDPRHFRLPLMSCWHQELVDRDWEPAQDLASKTGFCNFVYSNPSCARRNSFFHALSKYKKIDSGGRWLNNLSHRVDDKMDFLRRYKFTIAFENTSYPGYITEKMPQAFLARSLPIYWGNPAVHLDFDPNSFLNWHEFNSDEALVERVIELDQNDELYLQYMRTPCYHRNELPPRQHPDRLLDALDDVIRSDAPPVARQSGYWTGSWKYRTRLKSDLWKRRMNRWSMRLAEGLRIS